MKNRMSLIKYLILALGLVQLEIYAVEPNPTDEALYKDLMLLKTQIQESKNSVKMMELNISAWPSNRPAWTSKALTITRYSEKYDLYMWWQEGYLFGQAVPLEGTEIFICSPSWVYVQDIGNFVSGFDTVKFDDSDGSSICGDFIEPVIFNITQWDYIFEYYVDFNLPFNLVYSDDARLAVLVNGGVTTNGSSTAQRGTVAPNLDISIPSIDYESLGGTDDIWLELKYNGTSPDGSHAWKLGDGGYNN